ncbi:MAG: hypothetical protein OEV49_03590 [candidate division Zixibacteria bacterium]|nr:hypothetical protein [candidate division Zixibacteria bacterium]MDH3937830.1 hypothetical protein [candidate division Zixibacteria bacterium]MDH4035259.1 hypothetical protein [candidate division Zixibacteria bacterium]
MRLSTKVLGIFLGMAVLGFLVPHMPGEYLAAAEDCGIGCSSPGICNDLLEPYSIFACCAGWCGGYPGDDPVWYCTGSCSTTGQLCDCTQTGCHTRCP